MSRIPLTQHQIACLCCGHGHCWNRSPARCQLSFTVCCQVIFSASMQIKQSNVYDQSLNLFACVNYVLILLNCRSSSLNLASCVIQIHKLSKCKLNPKTQFRVPFRSVYILLQYSYIPLIKYNRIKHCAFSMSLISAFFSDWFYCLFIW